MSKGLNFTIRGIDRVDAMALEELLAEHASEATHSESPNHELSKGRLGSPDLLNFAIQIAPIAIPALVTVVTLWLTRKKKEKDSGGTILEIDGDKIRYMKFTDSEVTKSNDPDAIKAALTAKLEEASEE